MAYPSYTHDPDSTLDYQWNWTNWMATNDTIATATVTVVDRDTGEPYDNADDTTPAAIEQTLYDDTTVTAWISGGTPTYSPYYVVCHIECTSGRSDDRTIQLKIKER